MFAAAPACRLAGSLQAHRCKHKSPIARSRKLRMQLSAAETVQSSAGAADAPAAAGSVDGSELVPMAASLLERAKIVAATGEVDAAFQETFVSELEAELQALETRAHQAEGQASALEETLKATKDQFVRLNADFDNFRKRTAAEKEALSTSVKGDTVLALVPLVDNFELAKGQIKPATEGEQKIDAAYQGLYKQMVELFRSLGVEAVPGVGSPFDPNLHDAIMREPSTDVPENTVLEEFRKGFCIGDRLLRPAMVKVSFRPDASATPAQSSSDEAASPEGTTGGY